MSKSKPKLKYRSLHGYKYETLMFVQVAVDIPERVGIIYAGINDDGILWVDTHYAWDGPSGPTIDTKTFMRGSLFHDVLYQMIREGVLDRKYRLEADKLLRRICLEDGMSKFRAWYVYTSLRLFGARAIKPVKNPRGKIVTINVNDNIKI